MYINGQFEDVYVVYEVEVDYLTVASFETLEEAVEYASHIPGAEVHKTLVV